MISLLAALMAALPPVVAVSMRQVMRYLIERERWRSTERLVDRCGLAVLIVLPDVARELREPGGRRPVAIAENRADMADRR